MTVEPDPPIPDPPIPDPPATDPPATTTFTLTRSCPCGAELRVTTHSLDVLLLFDNLFDTVHTGDGHRPDDPPLIPPAEPPL